MNETGSVLPKKAAHEALWEFGDIGFDTSRKLWFVQLTDKLNQVVNTRHGHAIEMSGGTASQYQWKDPGEYAFWHIRERFFARDIESISDTPEGVVRIKFRSILNSQVKMVPDKFEYVLYAYHLTNKDPNDPKAPMGFLEFYGEQDQLIEKVDRKWILLEGVTHKTTGEYPRIRMRAERADIAEILVTFSCVVLRGPASQS
jgi:hypothetical protein